MGALIRTRSGIFNIEDAVTLNVFEQNPYEYIWPVEKALPYPRAYTQDPEEKRALNGNPLPLSMLGLTRSESDKYWVYSGERLIGLYKRDNNKLMPEAMMI
jgi:tRNA U55 pseudouridine synthase TruB